MTTTPAPQPVPLAGPDIRHQVAPALPTGGITLLLAPTQAGKTTLAIDLALRTALSGPPDPPPDGTAPGSAICIASPSLGPLGARFHAHPLSHHPLVRSSCMLSDMPRLELPPAQGLSLPSDPFSPRRPPTTDPALLELEIADRFFRAFEDGDVNPRLIVLDPLPVPSSDSAIGRSALARCLRILGAGVPHESGATLLATLALPRRSGGRDDDPFASAARLLDYFPDIPSVLLLTRDPFLPNRRILHTLRSPAHSRPPPLACDLAEDGVSITYSAAPGLPADPFQPRRLPAHVGPADRFLLQNLASAPVPAKTIFAAARALGLSTVSLRRAKKRLGIKSTRHAFTLRASWNWSLPGPDDDPAPEAPIKALEGAPRCSQGAHPETPVSPGIAA